MDNIFVLTLANHKFQALPYEGLPSQHYNIVAQADGSVSIRNTATDQVLTLSQTQVWASPYTGSKWQSLNIRNYADGTCTLHSAYAPVVLEITDSGVEPKPYITGHKTQRLVLLEQPDGSVGIGKAGLVFNTHDSANDLQGSLAANIKFAQSQIIPATPKPGDSQPKLTARRQALLLVKPLSRVDTLQVTVLDGGGEPLGSLTLNSPYQLPTTAYNIEGSFDDINFTPLPGPVYILNSHSEISQLNDPAATLLQDKLGQNAVVEIQTADGRWTNEIYCPNSGVEEGKMVRIQSHSSYSLRLFYSGRQVSVFNGETHQLKFYSGQWISEQEWKNLGLLYAENTWSVKLPAQWINPGMVMRIDSGELSGQLNNIPVGGATELLINTIDIGMLTPPRNEFAFANDPSAHREYFQTIPTARMIVSDYQSVHLLEVMLPDGTLLTDFDPSYGGAYEGTMRNLIGKELISLGINNANYGVNCSASKGEESPYMATQLTAHNSCGKYANGIVVHGLSGGAGIVTLLNSLGNEFSHEVGHNYGLGHYPGGFDGSVHRAATEINSTWGWDMDLNKFLPNFNATISNKETCLLDKCQPPFYGRAFGTDPMAGGYPMNHLNRFTLHTPHTAAIAQDFMETKAVFARDSATGFRKWDPLTQRMEPFSHRVNVSRLKIAPNSDLSAEAISALLNTYSHVKVAMANGNWAPSVHVPPATLGNAQCVISIEQHATYSSQIYINGHIVPAPYGFKNNYVSSGSSWTECIVLGLNMIRITAPNTALDLDSVKTLLTQYHVIHIAMQDDNWAPSINIPPASQANRQRTITIDHQASHNTTLHINGLIINIPTHTKKYFISDGKQWHERLHLIDFTIERSPQSFGVPIITLIGYYDALDELQSYIYPALHGAYGFSYADDRMTLVDSDCQLWVISEHETLRFKLDNQRIQPDVMNKYHINIAASKQPHTVALMRNGVVITQRTIEPAKRPLTYTVNGE